MVEEFEKINALNAKLFLFEYSRIKISCKNLKKVQSLQFAFKTMINNGS